MTPAKRIASAIARSGIYHKRTAILAALIALGCCIVVFVLDETVEKGLTLSFAVIFGFAAFRSLRRANLYFGLRGSPVLEAITQSPRRIAGVRPGEQGGAPTVVVTDVDGNELPLRVGPGDDALEELLDAFRHHSTTAKVIGPDVSKKGTPGDVAEPTPRGDRSS